MKAHTPEYKEQINLVGREIDTIITYNIDGVDYELSPDDIISINCFYEGNILKSVMKELTIESKIDVPKGTVLNFSFGIKVRDDEVEDYRDNYDYVNYGNYIVNKDELEKSNDIYELKCYDKMLYAMKDYTKMNITYPITIRNYINAICNELGLTFKNINNSFANYNKQIQNELYLLYNPGNNKWESFGYTFRDVLDELAQATGSTICINEEDDELEIRYINDTNDTINDDYIKNVSAKFRQKYGAINTVILSRSADSDKVYRSYPEDLPDNEKIAVQISDNQIMNFNDRADYLPDILNRLLNVEYYTNDFTSNGITYYNLCDKYNVEIDGETYPCIMFNNQISVGNGITEKIYTDMPDNAETDYTKADKTDRRINQTYLIVDKQNQTIESVVSQVSDQNEAISQITQTVNEINSKISDITDVTTSGESTEAGFDIEDINVGEPIEIRVHPIGESISYVYPSDHLYPTTQSYPAKVGLTPSSTLTPSNSLMPSTGYPAQDIIYLKVRTIRFTNTTTSEVFDYELPEDLLYYDADNYDEFVFEYGDGTPQTKICQVEKKCKYNADGTIGLLNTPETHDYISSYVPIDLTDGDYTISLLGYTQGYIFVRLLASNIYTTQFATKTELRQTASSITTSVEETYTTKEEANVLSSRIEQTAKNISLTVSNGSTSSGITLGITKEDGSTEQATGTIQMNGLVSFTNLSTSGQTQINGGNITTGTIDASQVNVTNIDASNISTGTLSANKISGGTISASTISLKNVSFSPSSSTVGGWTINNNSFGTNFYDGGVRWGVFLNRPTASSNKVFQTGNDTAGDTAYIQADGNARFMSYGNISLESIKKNFEKYQNALKTIKDIDIYKYNLKTEENEDKKHIGLVIGDNYKYSQEITSKENDAIDLYSFVSVCCQAIKEQQEIIEKLEERISHLEKESDK